ncbi:MAG TPA: DUF1587 domain-containing protein, partial [Polyangiaceae bacterium]|nr:DUF1587 domain-containing protein [Polyangiaceae bacterium]
MMVAPSVFRPYRVLFLGLVGLGSLSSLACTDGGGAVGANGGASAGAGLTGGSASGGSANGGSTGMPFDPSKGGPKLRVLTQLEYTNSLTDLLGPIKAQMTLPPDTFLGGFTSIGATSVAIN